MTQTDTALRDQLVLAYGEDPVLAARRLFPHWFPRPMPWFHRGMIAILLRRGDFLLNFDEEVWPEATGRWTKKKLAKLTRCFLYKVNPDDPNSPMAPIFRLRYGADGRTPVAVDIVLGRDVVIIIPRGFSKTTIINFCNIYKVLYKLTKFTVYISEAKDHAKDQINTIRRELAANENIRALYGKLKPDRSDEETWGSEQFETTTGIKFVAKGRGAQIRGLNKFADRPDTIVLDDVEDKESTATESQREKVLSWYKSDVAEALPRGRPGHIYMIGTILHPQALLPTRFKDPDFTGIQFGAIDPEGEALWDDPAGMTLEQIEKKRQSFARDGKLYEFGLEILSTVRQEDKLKFRREYIRYKQYQPGDFVARSIHIDPAISAGKDADYTCIAVVGITEKGHKHVCDFHAQRGMPMSEQARKYFDMRMAWDCNIHSCEATAYQAALAQVIRELMFLEAKKYGTRAYFEVREVWPKGRKVERVEGILQPIMAAGYLTFQQIWPELEVMFLDWPDAKLDGPDAIAGAVANLEPFAAFSFGDDAALEASENTPYDFTAPCAAGSGDVP